jgi:hypothetical protein
MNTVCFVIAMLLANVGQPVLHGRSDSGMEIMIFVKEDKYLVVQKVTEEQACYVDAGVLLQGKQL